MSRYTQPAYTSGMQIKTNKFIVRPDELILAKNVSNSILGSWKTRLGSTQLGDTLQAGKSVGGIFDDLTSGGQQLAVIDNSGSTQSVLKYNNAGIWTNISGATTLPAGLDANFLSFIDKTYIFGKGTSAFTTTASISGTTYAEQAAFPKAAFGVVFFDQVYLADCEVSGTEYANRIYFGSVPSYSGGWSFSFTTATDFLSANTNDGDYITGLIKSYGQLLCFKNFSVHAIDMNQNIIQVDGTGCTSPKSLVTDDERNCYYSHFSDKKKGIFKWDGTKSVKISRAIDPIIEGSSGTGVVGGINNDHVYQFIGNVTLNQDIAEYFGLPLSLSNVLLDYSILDDFWTIHTLPAAVTSMASYSNDLYLGTSEGAIYQWGVGSSDWSNDIESQIITHSFHGQVALEYNLRKSFNDLVINMHRSGRAQAFYSIDNGDWVPLGQLKEKVNVFSIDGKGYGLKVMLTANGGTFIFEGIEIGYTTEKPVKSV